MHTINTEIFEKPSGDVRGFVTLSMTFCKKEVRVGYTYLLVGKPAEMSVKAPPGRISAADAVRLGEALVAYAAEVSKADAVPVAKPRAPGM